MERSMNVVEQLQALVERGYRPVVKTHLVPERNLRKYELMDEDWERAPVNHVHPEQEERWGRELIGWEVDVYSTMDAAWPDAVWGIVEPTLERALVSTLESLAAKEERAAKRSATRA
jgi:hypothetical protein